MSERDVIFISHATPNDNEFVRWLGTRLTGYGYKVWADIFDLAGGTPFWISIEDAIRKRALKVIFVVSKASCDPDRSGLRNDLRGRRRRYRLFTRHLNEGRQAGNCVRSRPSRRRASHAGYAGLRRNFATTTELNDPEDCQSALARSQRQKIGSRIS
jgi:TIR domain